MTNHYQLIIKKQIKNPVIPMRNFCMQAAFILLMLSFFCSCSKKSGCPSNGKNVGAERLISGDKVPKAKKFKA